MLRYSFTVLVIGTLLFLSISDVNAKPHPKFGIGFSFGLAGSSSTGNYVHQENLDTRVALGLSGSLFASWRPTYKLSFQQEVRYGKRGHAYVSETSPNIDDIEFRLYTIETPLLAQYIIDLTRFDQLQLFAGPSFYWVVEHGFYVDFSNRRRGANFDVLNLNTTGMGFHTGFRVLFPAKRDRAFFEFRYSALLTPFLSDSDYESIWISEEGNEVSVGAPGDPSPVNHSFLVTVGMVFD